MPNVDLQNSLYFVRDIINNDIIPFVENYRLTESALVLDEIRASIEQFNQNISVLFEANGFDFSTIATDSELLTLKNELNNSFTPADTSALTS